MKLFLLIAVGLVAALADESQVLKEFSHGNVQYVSKLYKELLKEHSGNFLVCPLSIQSVFALVNGGARGNTSKQITTSLHLPADEEKVKKTFISLIKSLQTNAKYTLSSANKVYVALGFKVSEHYKDTAVNVFHADIQNIDFSKSQEAVNEINKWVEDKTHDKIKDLLSTGMVGPDTMAVLINALYFQGKWVKEFGDLITLSFHLNRNESVYTEFMTATDHYNYYESSELKAKFLELPYEGDDVSMTIVLPSEIDGLSTLENRISDVFAAPKYNNVTVEVYLPKFKIETTTHLIPVLQRLGITDAFTGAADFRGIGENEDSLMISEVVQKAFIEVDEKGTTAAAATAITMERSGRVRDDFLFYADRPFLFYLKHRTNGIMFVGRLSVANKVEV